MRLLVVILFAALVLCAFGFLLLDYSTQVELDPHGLTPSQVQLIEGVGELEVDEQTIMSFTVQGELMQAVKRLFMTQCASCHGMDGNGGTGPSLTDEKYILVRDVRDIYDVIKNGNISKGMPPWQGPLSNTKIVLLSSYVVMLRGSSNEGKFPEGTAIDPWPAK